jgi:hypothetical protein
VVHIFPELLHTWSQDYAYKQDMMDWCNQIYVGDEKRQTNGDVLKKTNYIIIHWGAKHFCSLILD